AAFEVQEHTPGAVAEVHHGAAAHPVVHTGGNTLDGDFVAGCGETVGAGDGGDPDPVQPAFSGVVVADHTVAASEEPASVPVRVVRPPPVVGDRVPVEVGVLLDVEGDPGVAGENPHPRPAGRPGFAGFAGRTGVTLVTLVTLRTRGSLFTRGSVRARVAL